METLQILFLNWRDIRNPEAGGAEVFTHEVAKRLAAQGHGVTVFAGGMPGGPARETIDGVEVVREGDAVSVYRKARSFVRRNGRQLNVLIEEVNTRPFFARPTSHNTRYLVVIHQLAREFWNAEFPIPISTIGRYVLEPFWLSRLRREIVLVPSPSTAADLRRLGFHKISQFRYGLANRPLAELSRKPSPPTFMFLGRLKSTKLPEEAVKAFLQAKQSLPEARMLVVGGGPLLSRLRRRYAGNAVVFLGPKHGPEKLDLLGQAHILLVPGLREGWGMVVTEANSMGTPAIAYDVPGLRDSVRVGETGILVGRGDTPAMAREAVSLLADTGRYERLRSAALEYSRQFTWDRTVDALRSAFAPD
jgi:glycosyltransferase involved in cell wall biosynthesis